MTFPYGTVLRDSTDGEVVMVVRKHYEGVIFWEVVVLAPATSLSYDAPIEINLRAVDMPQWERLP